MYKRYQPISANGKHAPSNNRKIDDNILHQPLHEQHTKKDERAKVKPHRRHPLSGFIPQSIYNPENGKILGMFSADDLLIAALILFLIDSDDGYEDNSMLIYALLYVLLSDHIDLPF